MTVNTIPIWLDCDPGHDDAIAILLSCFHPAFRLLGLSASYGNAPLENTTYNARSLITAFGRSSEVQIYPGAQKPWVLEPEYAPDVHGTSGLDGTTLLPIPDCELVSQKTYLDAMEEAILANSGEISLVSTGALTSVATLLRDRPHLRKLIKYISIMGGGFDIGNRNPNDSAEFNIWIDPHAANFLFSDPEIKNKCILLPLNLTHKAIATPEIQNHIRSDGKSSIRVLFFELFQFFERCYKDAQGFDHPPTHDPLTLMPLLEFYGWESPSVVQFKFRRLDLYVTEDVDSADLGKISILKEYKLDEGVGITVGFNMNIDFFWEQVFNALDQVEQVSTIEHKN